MSYYDTCAICGEIFIEGDRPYACVYDEENGDLMCVEHFISKKPFNSLYMEDIFKNIIRNNKEQIMLELEEIYKKRVSVNLTTQSEYNNIFNCQQTFTVDVIYYLLMKHFKDIEQSKCGELENDAGDVEIPEILNPLYHGYDVGWKKIEKQYKKSLHLSHKIIYFMNDKIEEIIKKSKNFPHSLPVDNPLIITSDKKIETCAFGPYLHFDDFYPEGNTTYYIIVNESQYIPLLTVVTSIIDSKLKNITIKIIEITKAFEYITIYETHT